MLTHLTISGHFSPLLQCCSAAVQWLHASCRLGGPKFKVSGEQDTAGQLTVSVPPGYILNIWVHYEESVQSLKMVCVGVAGAGWAGADSVGLAGSSGQVWV